MDIVLLQVQDDNGSTETQPPHEAPAEVNTDNAKVCNGGCKGIKLKLNMVIC